MKRIIAVCMALLGGIGTLGAEIGSADNLFEGFPSYSVQGEVGEYPGVSLGIGGSALANLNALGSTALPFLTGLPTVWVGTQAVVLDTGLAYGLFKPGTPEASDLGSLLGFGGQTFKLNAAVSLVQWEQVSGFKYYNTYRTAYYDITGPQTLSLQVLAGVGVDRVGGSVVAHAQQGTTAAYSARADGWNTFVETGVRLMGANLFRYKNDSGEEASPSQTMRSWGYQDLKLGLSADLSMVGVSYEMTALGQSFPWRFGVGVYQRSDKSLYIPLWIALGWGGTPLALANHDQDWIDNESDLQEGWMPKFN